MQGNEQAEVQHEELSPNAFALSPSSEGEMRHHTSLPNNKSNNTSITINTNNISGHDSTDNLYSWYSSLSLGDNVSFLDSTSSSLDYTDEFTSINDDMDNDASLFTQSFASYNNNNNNNNSLEHIHRGKCHWHSCAEVKKGIRDCMCSFSTFIALMLFVLVCCAYVIIWSSTTYMSRSAIHDVWEVYHETTVSLSNERLNIQSSRIFAIIFDIAVGLWDKEAFFESDAMAFLCSFMKREFSDVVVHSLELASIDHGETVFCAQEYDNAISKWFYYGGYSTNGSFNASYLVNISSLHFATPLTTWFKVEEDRRNVSAWLSKLYKDDVYMNSFRTSNKYMSTIMQNNLIGWRSDVNEVYSLTVFFPLRVWVNDAQTNTSQLDTSVYLKLRVNPHFYLRQRGTSESNVYKMLVLIYTTLHWADPVVFANNWWERTTPITNNIASDFQTTSSAYLRLSNVSAPLMRAALPHVNVPSLSIDNYRHTSQFTYASEPSLVTGQLYFTDNLQAVASILASTEKEIAPHQQRTEMIILVSVACWIVLMTALLWFLVFILLVKPLRLITHAVEQSTRRLCASRPFVAHYHWRFGLKEVYKLITAYNASMRQLKQIETFLPATRLNRLRDLHYQHERQLEEEQQQETTQENVIHLKKEKSNNTNTNNNSKVVLKDCLYEHDDDDDNDLCHSSNQCEKATHLNKIYKKNNVAQKNNATNKKVANENNKGEATKLKTSTVKLPEPLLPSISVPVLMSPLSKEITQLPTTRSTSFIAPSTHRPENDQNIRMVHTVVYVIPTSVLKSKNVIKPIMETSSSSSSEHENSEQEQTTSSSSSSSSSSLQEEETNSVEREEERPQHLSLSHAAFTKADAKDEAALSKQKPLPEIQRYHHHHIIRKGKKTSKEEEGNKEQEHQEKLKEKKENASPNTQLPQSKMLHVSAPRALRSTAGTVFRSSSALEEYLSVIMHAAHNCGGILHAIHPMYAVVHFNAAVRELFEREVDWASKKGNNNNNNNNNKHVSDISPSSSSSSVLAHEQEKQELHTEEEKERQPHSKHTSLLEQKGRYAQMEMRAKEIDAEAAIRFAFTLQRQLQKRKSNLPHATLLLDTTLFISGQYYSASLDQVVLPLTGRNIWHDVAYILPIIGVNVAMSEETALLVRQSVRQVPIEVLYVTRKSMLGNLHSYNNNSSASNSGSLSDESYSSKLSNTSTENKEKDKNNKMKARKGNANEGKHEHVARTRRKSKEFFRNTFSTFHRHRHHLHGGSIMNMYDENESRTYKLVLYDVISGSVNSPLWVPLAHSCFEVFSLMLFAKYKEAKDELEQARRRIQSIQSSNIALSDVNEKQINYAERRLYLYEHICRTHLVERDRTRFIRYPIGLMHDATVHSLPSPTLSPSIVTPTLFNKHFTPSQYHTQQELLLRKREKANKADKNHKNNVDVKDANPKRFTDELGKKIVNANVDDKNDSDNSDSFIESVINHKTTVAKLTNHAPTAILSSPFPSTLPKSPQEEEEELFKKEKLKKKWEEESINDEEDDVCIVPKLTKQVNRVLHQHKVSPHVNADKELKYNDVKEEQEQHLKKQHNTETQKQLLNTKRTSKQKHPTTNKVQHLEKQIAIPASTLTTAIIKWNVTDTNGNLWYVSWPTRTNTLATCDNINSNDNNSNNNNKNEANDINSVSSHMIKPVKTYMCLSSTGTLATIRFWFFRPEAVNKIRRRHASTEFNESLQTRLNSFLSETLSSAVPSSATSSSSSSSFTSTREKRKSETNMKNSDNEKEVEEENNDDDVVVEDKYTDSSNGNNASIMILNDINRSTTNSSNNACSSPNVSGSEILSFNSLLSKMMGGSGVVNSIGLSLQYSDCIGIISEFYVGGDLRTILARYGRALPMSLILRYSYSILNNLLYIHENELTHGHLSPSEIMLCTDGTCKLRGVFTNLFTARELLTFPFTPYASPELLLHKTCTAANDMYAFGLILLEMMTGHMPWKWSSSVIPTRTSKELERIINSDDETEFVNATRFHHIELNYDDVDINQCVLCDILSQCLRTDPSRRINVADAVEMLSIVISDEL